jgi:succinate dehydrogenase / fumarate reductase flavoprotein subunit
MYHQFKELADVDIMAEPMEVGPTCHYVMGGVEVDPDSQAAVGVSGLFAAGEVSGGMHGSNRLGGNSLSDLLVFGRRAGSFAAAYVAGLEGRPSVLDADVEDAVSFALAPLSRTDGENPYQVQLDLQKAMHELVGIIRKAPEIESALSTLVSLRERASSVSAVGGRTYNPGWHVALDLRNLLVVAECVARAALIREESRGGHTRDDFPEMSAEWRRRNLICSLNKAEPGVIVREQPLPTMPVELLSLFDRKELSKYLTEEELSALASSPEAPSAVVAAARQPSEDVSRDSSPETVADERSTTGDAVGRSHSEGSKG